MRAFLAGLRGSDTPTFEAFTRELGDAFPLLGQLPGTLQDLEWHAEGDVGTHTDLVLREMYHLADTHGLSGDVRLTLTLAAALHDVGKALTTRREYDSVGRRRIISPRHADRGRSYLAYRLPELALPHAVTRHVLALVGHHHDLTRTLNVGTERAYRRLARQVDVRLLYLLEVADTRGRVAEDRDSRLEDLELFRLGAEEFGVWNNPDPYVDWRAEIREQLRGLPEAYIDLTVGAGILDYEAGVISTPHEAVARAYAARSGFPDLTVTVGPSGAGKSAWVAERYPDHAIVSLDLLRDELAGKRADQSVNGRVLQAAKEQLRVALRARRPVVWDATNTRRDFRGVPLRLGFEYGALTTLAVFQVPLSTVFEQNPARTHAVPAQVIAAQVEHLEYPYLPEAHRTLVIGEYGQVLERHGFLS